MTATTKGSDDVVLPMLTTLTKLPHDVYMGRKFRSFKGGYWGNPFKGEDWSEMFEMVFRLRVRHDPEFALRVLGLRGLACACFCTPNPCHVDIIRAYVNAQPIEACMAAFDKLEKQKIDRRSANGPSMLEWWKTNTEEMYRMYPEGTDRGPDGKTLEPKQ